ncbi:hypothetical protein ABMA27_015831 [Loxostege sticticalis]|uniref:Cyclic AMP response element-binding protein A n=1 Tax=Loxostege sticticalis TaxID=481309 RepID=A0ABR3I4I8_LOXSC
MTDAALGAAPIKTEHSYSLHPNVESAPSSPHHTKVDDMEDECYPAMPASAWGSRRRSSESPPRVTTEVKMEPKSEPESPASSCPPSPTPGTPVTHLDYVIDHTTGTIHMPQAVLQKVGAAGVPQLLLSAAPRLANSLSSNKLSIKVTSSSSSKNSFPGFNLPPTPPSSLSSSDSEGALSPAHEAPPAPAAAPAKRNHLYVSHHSRQPINTPLISSQPKGSTGTLMLTEEEKRTLLAEGYPVPTRLPLTKAEEKSLKKIRRKIKNKISAQESRRKKKEYMDQLERKVEILVSENSDYRKRVETLEQKNASLLSQLAALQALVARGRK